MKWWWLNMVWTPAWSDEEVSVRARILGVSGFVFLLVYAPVLAVLHQINVERHVAAIGTMFVLGPPALYVGRQLSKQLWPELVRKADENAAKRIGG